MNKLIPQINDFFRKLYISILKIPFPFTSKKKHRVLYYLIFIGFSVFMMFSLRSPLLQLTELINGESYLAFDELIPIFDIETQFIDQVFNGYSTLTNTNEIRVRYSALSTWVRYYPILLISLILINALTLLILVYSSKRFLDICLYNKSVSQESKILYSLLINLPIYILLMYGKVTHFYTLLLGLAIFSLSFVLSLEFVTEKKISLKKVFIILILTLINPAVHYHVFYLIIATILFLFGFLYRILKKTTRIQSIKFGFISFAIIFLNIVIYATLLLVGNTSYSLGNLSDVAPVNYLSLAGSSPSVTNIISVDIYSPIDNYLYRNYLPPESNILNIIFLLVALIPLYKIIKDKAFRNKPKNYFSYFFVILIVFVSIYLALGLSFKYHIYSIIADNNDSAFFRSSLGTLILKALDTFVQVIRFPHRFQLLYIQALGLAGSFGLYYLYNFIGKINLKSWIISKKDITIGIGLIFILVPFVKLDILNVLILSGNWNGIFEPIKIEGKELINNIISKEDKVFYAPYLEFNNYIEDKNGNQHRFIDKFWLYYFNENSAYYGLGGASVNKFDAFLFYRAALYEDNWWVKILKDDGYNYILNIKNTKSSTFDTDRSVDRAIESNSNLKKVFDNEYFQLYKIDDYIKSETNIVLTEWNNYIRLMNENSEINSTKFEYLPTLLSTDLNGRKVLTDDASNINLFYEAIEHSERLFNIPKSQLTFNKNAFTQSNFQTGVLSYFNLLSENPQYNKIGMQFPSVLLKTTGTYVAFKEPQTFNIPFSVKDKCNLYINSISTNNSIDLDLFKSTGEYLESSKISFSDTDISLKQNVSFTNSGLNSLEEGKYIVKLLKNDSNPFVLNYFMCSDENYQENLVIENIDNVILSNGKALQIFKKSDQ